MAKIKSPLGKTKVTLPPINKNIEVSNYSRVIRATILTHVSYLNMVDPEYKYKLIKEKK